MIVAPSLLAADMANLEVDIRRLNQTDFKMLHLDIMDGHFVPNISFGPAVVQALRPLTTMLFDVHLMISDPIKYLDEFIKAGADYITFHYEAVTDVIGTIKKIKDRGIKVGISIKPTTSPDKIKEYLDFLDLILVMSVEPGFGGQAFQPSSIEKIKTLKKWREEANLNYYIQVDGGINQETVKLVKTAGVDIVVAGTYLFKHPSLKQAKLSLE